MIEKFGDIPGRNEILAGRIRRSTPIVAGHRWVGPTSEIREEREALERFAIKRVMKRG